MKTITFQRPEESFNKHLSYNIFVGEKKLAELKNGEEKTIEIPADLEKEILRAKNRWCGSEDYPISELSETVILKVSGNEFLNKKMPFIGTLFPLIGIIIFSSNSQLISNIGIGFMVLLILGLIATLTVWKNKWLKVETK